MGDTAFWKIPFPSRIYTFPSRSFKALLRNNLYVRRDNVISSLTVQLKSCFSVNFLNNSYPIQRQFILRDQILILINIWFHPVLYFYIKAPYFIRSLPIVCPIDNYSLDILFWHVLCKFYNKCFTTLKSLCFDCIIG